MSRASRFHNLEIFDFSLTYRVKMNTRFARAHFSSDKLHYNNKYEKIVDKYNWYYLLYNSII